MSDDVALDPAALDRLLDITGGDLEFLDELIDTYLDDAVVQIDALRAALGTADIGSMVRPAHSLKSNSDNVGAVALTTLCRALETDAKAGTVDDPAGRVAAISSAFETVRAGLLAARAAR